MKKQLHKTTWFNLFGLILISLGLNAQNNNGAIDAPGDIAFVAYHDNVDGFSFILLDDCPVDASIRFTDEEWDGEKFDTPTGEGEILWVNSTNSIIKKGTIIIITGASDTVNDPIDVNIGTATEDELGFGTANIDELFAITGTRANPGTFLAFIGDSVGNSIENTGLITGETAIFIKEEGFYSGSTECNSTLNDCAAMINTIGNWTITQNNEGYDYPDEVAEDFTGTAIDNVAPSGYSVTIDQDPITSSNEDSVSFTFAGAEVGTTYSYTFTTSGGSASITAIGTIQTSSDQITGINLSGLANGTITLSVTLTDDSDNTGLETTDTSIKDETLSIAENTLSVDDFSFINPVENTLELNSSYQITSIQIYDLKGTLIVTSNKRWVGVSNLSSGIYIAVVAVNKGKTAALRIVKK